MFMKSNSYQRMIVALKSEAHLLFFIKTDNEEVKMSKEPNTVFIGRKPPMNYVLAVITLFSAGSKEVTLKARGQAITTAIDAAEITRRRFMQGLKVNKINLGTDEVQMQEGGTRNVSTIEITLTTEAKPKEEAKTTQKAKESA